MIPWRKTASNENEQTAPVKSVLVIHLGGLSGFVQALAAAAHIRDAHVGARIALLTVESSRSLAEKCPYFDVVMADGKPSEAQAITGLIKRLRAAKYDLVYDLECSSRTNNYFQGLRPWPPKWCGIAPGSSHRVPEAPHLAPLDRYAAQLRAAGIALSGPLMPDLTWLRQALGDPPRLRPEYYGVRGSYVLLLPRGSDAAPSRRWPQEKYIELSRRLAGRGVTPVVLGGVEERPIGAAIAQAEPKAKNLVTRPDLFQSIGLAERASFAVGDDVDLMHVAAAGGAPCLVLMSSNAGEPAVPRGPSGVIELKAAVVADLPVEQIERQVANCGVFLMAATA